MAKVAEVMAAGVGAAERGVEAIVMAAMGAAMVEVAQVVGMEMEGGRGGRHVAPCDARARRRRHPCGPHGEWNVRSAAGGVSVNGTAAWASLRMQGLLKGLLCMHVCGGMRARMQALTCSP